MSGKVVDCTDSPPVGRKAVLLFWAPWHEASTGPMDQVLGALAASASDDTMLFGRVQAEECPEVAKKYNVTAVPTFVLLNASGAVLEILQGNEDMAQVTQAVQRLMQAPTTVTEEEPPAPTTVSPEDTLSNRLNRLIRSSEVMLFMKGNPTAPRCGFSRQAVELLQAEDIPFGSFDILTDEAVRQGLKKHSDWPTYPQIYVKGELVGGLDILKEMQQEGSLRKQLGIVDYSASTEKEPSLDERLGQLVKRHRVMLFMKGLPSAPRCGFSRQMVEILDAEKISYDSFDILQDEEVRQGLKKYSDWPTFPQLYVDGDLIGGLDIVKEMTQDGSLREALGGS